MARNLSDVRQEVKQILRGEFSGDVTDEDWKDDEIDIHIGHTLENISLVSPNVVKEVLTTIENSTELDISAIENLLWVEKAEYPTGNSPRDYRNIKKIDRETIELDTTITPLAGGSSTLTGTVTFTSGSTAVTGSGTDFDGELKAGYHIKASGGTRWYRIYSITDGTNLVLAEACRSGDTGADTENATQYCYETAYLFCAKLHELDEDSSTLGPAEESVLIDGSIASTALSWINTLRTHIKKSVDLMGSSETAISSISDRINQSIDDLNKGRTQIDDTRATAESAIDNMVARINMAMDNLSIGQTFINKINYGGSPENDYANYAARELSNANAFLNQARGYMSEGNTADGWGAYAARELQNASSLLNQAGAYIRQSSSRLSIASAVRAYQEWANIRMGLYHKSLRKIEKAKDWREYPKD